MDVHRQLQQQLSDSFCNCHNVTYKEISLLVRKLKSIKGIEDLHRYVTVCRECNKCEADVKKIIEFYKKEPFM